jgi:hypothetical protein
MIQKKCSSAAVKIALSRYSHVKPTRAAETVHENEWFAGFQEVNENL